MNDLVRDFCAMFEVDVVNKHSDDEGNEYFDFVDNSGSHVLTLAIEQIPIFMDRATGHAMPYSMMSGPTHKHYAEFTEKYYRQ